MSNIALRIEYQTDKHAAIISLHEEPACQETLHRSKPKETKKPRTVTVRSFEKFFNQ